MWSFIGKIVSWIAGKVFGSRKFSFWSGNNTVRETTNYGSIQQASTIINNQPKDRAEILSKLPPTEALKLSQFPCNYRIQSNSDAEANQVRDFLSKLLMNNGWKETSNGIDLTSSRRDGITIITSDSAGGPQVLADLLHKLGLKVTGLRDIDAKDEVHIWIGKNVI